MHPNGQSKRTRRRKPLSRIRNSEGGGLPTVRDNTLPLSSALQASPKPFSLTEYSALFLKTWVPRSRFSNHDRKTQLAILGLAAAFGSVGPDMALTVSLRPGERPRNFIDKLEKAVSRAGGRKLSYFGVAASLPWHHLHLVLSLPSGSIEHEVVQAFLIRREAEYLAACRKWDRRPKSPQWHLRRGGGAAEPLKPVHFASLTDGLPRYNRLPGYTRYLAHHFKDAERTGYPGQHQVEIVASEDIRGLAREISRREPEYLPFVLEAAGHCWTARFEQDGEMLLRVIAQRRPDMPLKVAVRRVVEGWLEHVRQFPSYSIPVVQAPTYAS